MDALEQMISELLWIDGYWVRASFAMSICRHKQLGAENLDEL